jgi:tryptophan synthase alpha chain
MVGFGVKTGEQAKAIAQGADGVVVGSAIVQTIEKTLGSKGEATAETVPAVLGMVAGLAQVLKS